MDLFTIFGYVLAYGFLLLFLYIARLLSAFFSKLSELMFLWVKPIVNTAQKWVSAINNALSGHPGPGKDFIAHWFGSPLLIIFMLVISGYTGISIFRLIASVGIEGFLIELLSHSSVLYLAELTNQTGTDPSFSAVDILVDGGNALLLAALTDLFISQLFPHRSNWLKEPLSYFTIAVYGLVFMAFTYTLGDFISAELFITLPKEFWHATWFTLPPLPVVTMGGFGAFAAELWLRFQWTLNTAVSFGFCFVLLAGLFFILSNVFSTLSCAFFTFILGHILSVILGFFFPETKNFELLLVAILTVGIVLIEVLFQSEPVSDLIESTRPFQFVTDVAKNITSYLEEFFSGLPISTLAILFSGILGGPCFLLAIAGVMFFLFDGFSVQVLLTAGVLFVIFLVSSIPCLYSALKRGKSKKTTALYFVIFVCFAIPLANLYYIINILRPVL